MIKKIILAALILSLVLMGCQKTPVQSEKTESETPTTPTTEESSLDIDVSEIDSLDEDLNLGELENLEAELDEINW